MMLCCEDFLLLCYRWMIKTVAIWYFWMRALLGRGSHQERESIYTSVGAIPVKSSSDTMYEVGFNGAFRQGKIQVIHSSTEYV